VGERSLHTREVAGSKPAAPIIIGKARYGGLSIGRVPPPFFLSGPLEAWWKRMYVYTREIGVC
jgi:hypothetical protein